MKTPIAKAVGVFFVGGGADLDNRLRGNVAPPTVVAAQTRSLPLVRFTSW